MKSIKDHDNDFGFSFSDDTPQSNSIEELRQANIKIETLQDYLGLVEKIILPLLENLKKNPEKAYIKWENRVPVIDEQIKKITSYTRSEPRSFK